MNETDKIEIENLLDGIKKMDVCAKTSEMPYYDDRIAKFAKEAVEDYENNKHYIAEIIRKHPDYFFNMKEFRVGDTWADGYKADRGERFGYLFGTGFNIGMWLLDYDCTSCDGYKHIFNVRTLDFDESSIRWYTSDTKDKRYSVCSHSDLVDNIHDGVAKIPYYSHKNVKGWQSLYYLATWTRAKNKLMMDEFKKSLSKIIDNRKAIADDNEKRHGAIAVIETYTKVTI